MSTNSVVPANAPIPRLSLPVLIPLLIILGVAPLFIAQLTLLWKLPMYQFFPFVLTFVGYMVWKRWQTTKPSPGRRVERPWTLEIVLLLFSALVLVLHGGMFGPWLANISFLAAVAAAIFAIQRYRPLRLWDLWLLLWVMVPPPLSLDGKLAELLQSVSSHMSSLGLDFFRVNHVLLGNVIELPAKQLFVDEACSGIISVMSVIACAAMLAVWRQRTLLQALLLIAIGVGWAIVMNTVRIGVIAVAQANFDVDLSTGWQHETLGLLVFLGTAAALFSSDILIEWVMAPIPVLKANGLLARTWNAITVKRTATLPPEEAVTPARAPRVAMMVIAALFGVLGLYHTAVIANVYVHSHSFKAPAIQAALALSEESLPDKIGEWQRIRYELTKREHNTEFGDYSHMYRYQRPQGAETLLSIDFPFRRDWHELCGCYESSGWQRNKRVIETTEEPTAIPEFVTATYGRLDTGEFGYLVFGILDKRFEPVTPPKPRRARGILESFVFRLQQRRPVGIDLPTSFQIQVFASKQSEFTEQERADLNELFHLASKEITNAL